MIEVTTREQKLLMNLIRASSAGKQSRQLETFLDDLDNAGWLIELARLHLRLNTAVSLTHQTFAHILQLREARHYRICLVRNDSVKARMVDLARACFSVVGEHAVTRTQQLPEYQRLQRAINIGDSNRKGRKLGETFYTADQAGEELEALRLRSKLRLKDWAVRIGTSENTYRRRLDDRMIPPEWVENARVVVAKQEEFTLQHRSDEIPVSNTELTSAFSRVWQSYVEQTDRLQGRSNLVTKAPSVQETPEQKAAREAAEDAELLKFTPSPEDDGEDLEVEIGSVDENDRVQPEDLDEHQ